MTEQTTAPSFPPGRYGRRRAARPARPWLAVLLAAVVAAGFGAVGYRLYTQYGDDEYTARIVAETERTQGSVTIRFEVRSRSGRTPAVCRVRARALDGLVVGSAEVPVPAGQRVLQTYTLATSARAFAIDITRCWAATEDR